MLGRVLLAATHKHALPGVYRPQVQWPDPEPLSACIAFKGPGQAYFSAFQLVPAA